MPKLIGITGRARSGKDTLGAALAKLGYRRVSFADALKRATAEVAGEDPALYFNDESKEAISPSLGMTRRSALQNVGQALRGALGADVWIKRALYGALSGPTVVTDVRYDNEALAIRSAGGIIVGLSRPDNDEVGLKGPESRHVSERPIDIDLVDVFMVNDGTIEDFDARALRLDQLVLGHTRMFG